MAGFKYFGNKSWADITREERYFCAELFFDIRNNIKGFIYFLNKRFQTNYEVEKHWEVGYEVCFYRDYLYSKGKKVRLTEFSDKRTFDLCLFSNSNIIIIEAKVDQKFDDKQLNNLKTDIGDVIKVLGEDKSEATVVTYLLNSSHRENEIEGFEKLKFTWQDLYNLFNDNPIYLTADELPLRDKPKS